MTREDILKLARERGYEGELEAIYDGQFFGDQFGEWCDFDAILELAEWIWPTEKSHRSNSDFDEDKMPQTSRGFSAHGGEVWIDDAYEAGFNIHNISSWQLHNLTDCLIEARNTPGDHVIDFVSKSLEGKGSENR